MHHRWFWAGLDELTQFPYASATTGAPVVFHNTVASTPGWTTPLLSPHLEGQVDAIRGLAVAVPHHLPRG